MAAKTPKPITDTTMRAMHAALRVHDFNDSDAIHEYLTVATGRPVESRKDLTEDEARKVIDSLATGPRPITATSLARLRATFPEEAVGKLPRSTCQDCSKNRGTCDRHPRKSRCSVCGNYHSDSTMHLDYVGHADVTARLLEVDPEWTWTPFTMEQMQALPPKLRDAGLWINLTVLGVTRPGFGDADGKTGGNAVKECIGDALRNGAMRFGVALDLWAKGDREWAHAEKDEVDPDRQPDQRQDTPADPPWTGPSTGQSLDRLAELAIAQGIDVATMTAKFREANGGLSEEALSTVPAWALAGLVERIETYLAQQNTNPTEGAPS